MMRQLKMTGTLVLGIVVIFGGLLQADDVTEGIRKVQLTLKEKGFDPGTVDGQMGSRTRQAIRDFQKANNLSVTGRLDLRTQSALGVEVVVPPARGNAKDELDRAENAAAVISEIMEAPDQRIPSDLLERAHAVAVVPKVVKGAFGFGGRYGKGLISKRLQDGSWGPPAYISIGGGSFGLQLGVSATDLILVFTDHSGVDGLLRGRVKLGADVGATAGPVGRTAEAGVDVTLASAIYSYSRSRGLFAGVSLDGAVVSLDNQANRRVYGVSGREALLDGQVPFTTVTVGLVDALNKHAPRRTR